MRDACVLCGHDPACGYASTHDRKRLCHTNDHSCYHRWTVYGDRLGKPGPTPEEAVRSLAASLQERQ